MAIILFQTFLCTALAALLSCFILLSYLALIRTIVLLRELLTFSSFSCNFPTTKILVFYLTDISFSSDLITDFRYKICLSYFVQIFVRLATYLQIFKWLLNLYFVKMIILRLISMFRWSLKFSSPGTFHSLIRVAIMGVQRLCCSRTYCFLAQKFVPFTNKNKTNVS